MDPTDTIEQQAISETETKTSAGEAQLSKWTLADRMKSYEKEAWTQNRLSPELPYVIRLDGHCFSQFTKGFLRPYDLRLYNVMDRTCEDLFRAYHPATIYTQSDEISLLFAPRRLPPRHSSGRLWQEPQFGGRIVKTSTVMAGYASARFNYHLQQCLGETANPVLRHKVGQAHFDARAFSLPNSTEVYNYVCWRSKYDGYRNAVSAVARQYFKHQVLVGMSTMEKLAALRSIDIDYEATIDERHQFGRYFKREAYITQALNLNSGELSFSVRSRPFGFSQSFLSGYDAEFEKLLLSRCMNQPDDQEEESDSKGKLLGEEPREPDLESIRSAL